MVAAGPAVVLADAAARSLYDRGSYVAAVLEAPVRFAIGAAMRRLLPSPLLCTVLFVL